MWTYIIFSLISLPIFCVDIQSAGQPFARINEEKSTHEVAYRSYISPDGKTTIQLIGIEHYAIPEFYQTVQSMIAGKVVLYELHGHTLEDEQKIEDREALLGNVYNTRRRISRVNMYLPDALGCVSQAVMSYDGCAEVIHADRKQPAFNVDDFINLPDEEIKQIIDSKARHALKENDEYDVMIHTDSKLDENLGLLPAIFAAKNSQRELSSHIRQVTKQALEDVDLIRSGELPIGLIKDYGARWEKHVLERNEIIFEALRNVLSRSQVPTHISIPYGFSHLLFVEHFLLKNGYQPITGSDGWLVTAKLCPLTAATGVDATDVKKIYLSADGLMKIYLIGRSTNDEISKGDKLFVLSRIFGCEKSLNGKLVEIAYSPDDIDYVGENLLRLDFVLISEAPFVRNNNKEGQVLYNGDGGLRWDSFEIGIDNYF